MRAQSVTDTRPSVTTSLLPSRTRGKLSNSDFNHLSHGESGEVRGERVTDMGDRDPDDDAARGLIRMVRGLTLR